MSYGNSYYIERIESVGKTHPPETAHTSNRHARCWRIPADSSAADAIHLAGALAQDPAITNARSSLQSGSVLVWLLRRLPNHPRCMRACICAAWDLAEDAEVQPNETWKGVDSKYRDSFSEIDPEEGDYARVLQLINEFFL